jgi:DNA-binding response OmpR family regulator
VRQTVAPEPEKALTYSDEHLAIDHNGRRVLMSGERVQPTRTEFRLLAYQLRHAGPTKRLDRGRCGGIVG